MTGPLYRANLEGSGLSAAAYLEGVAREQLGDTHRWRCVELASESASQAIVDFSASEGVDLIAFYVRERKGIDRLIKRTTSRPVQRMATMEVRILGLRDWEIYLSQQANTGSGFEPPLPEEADQPVDSDILQDLSDDEIDEVANLGSAWQVSAGTLLGQAGEQADRLFIILKGEARLSYQTQIGEVAVRIAKPGDSFPLAALLGSGGTITTGQALTDMNVFVIPRIPFIALCTDAPNIGMCVYKAAAKLFAERYSKTLAHLGAPAVSEVWKTEGST